MVLGSGDWGIWKMKNTKIKELILWLPDKKNQVRDADDFELVTWVVIKG